MNHSLMYPYKINIINATVFISCGLIGFIGHYLKLGDYQQAALIPFVLGTLLLVMTPGMKSNHVIIAKAVILLTLICGIGVLILLFQCMGSDTTSARKMILLTIIALSSFGSFGIYFSNWLEERKNRR